MVMFALYGVNFAERAKVWLPGQRFGRDDRALRARRNTNCIGS